MCRAILLRLLALTILLGFHSLMGSPTTTIVANGLGTTVTPPAGGIYNITGGTTVGTNLFHSLSTFTLGAGDTVDFDVTSGITNILARITGGPSTIDGTITSTIGAGGPLSSASLYLINPAGVMFSANAQVNLGGSFIVTTANYIKFSDGSFFYGDIGHPIQDAGLSSAPVSAFGFLSSSPATVSATGSQLTMQAGMGLHVISGDVNIDGAALSAPAGDLTIFSAAGGGEVPFTLASPGSGYATATVNQLGSISFSNGAQAAIDGAGGGALVIRGGKITVNNSYITSGNFGPVVGGNISVQATQLTITNGGYIATDSFGGAKAGSVTVNVAQNLDISGTGSQISADTETAGAGGVVTANVGGAVNLDGGDIFANTDSSGSGGAVSVTAGSMTMMGNARLSSITDGTGNAGTVNLTLTSGPLTMTDTSGILADTYKPGNGGNIAVTAPEVSLTGQALISANTFFSTGKGGNVTVDATSLSIQGTGTQPPNSLGITAQSFGSGNAGNISVSCSQAVLSGQGLISASSEATNAGSVQILAANSLTLSSGGSINTSAADNGGNVTLRVGRLLYLTDSNIEAYAGVSSFPGQQVGGNGGNIVIDPEFVVLNNSLISANDLSGVGQNGNIVNLANFFFTSDSLLHATGTIETTPPDLDLAAGLIVLPGILVDEQSKLRETCAQSVNHEFSTFIVVGRGGTEAAPEELHPDFGMGLRETAPDCVREPSVGRNQTEAHP